MRFPYPATNIQDRILRKPSFRTARRSRPKSCGVEFKTAYPLLLRKQLIRADIQVALFLRIYLDDSGTKPVVLVSAKHKAFVEFIKNNLPVGLFTVQPTSRK
jgi:hypothetical protein